jgi:hypothetical protein
MESHSSMAVHSALLRALGFLVKILSVVDRLRFTMETRLNEGPVKCWQILAGSVRRINACM